MRENYYDDRHRGCSTVFNKIRVSALCLMMIFCTTYQAIADTTQQQPARVTVDVKNANISSVIKLIRQQTGYSFFYEDKAVERIANITLNMKQAKIEDVLEACLKGSEFSYRFVDKTIILFKKNTSVADQHKKLVIKGRVIDAKGAPMPGAGIIMEGTTIGTATDGKGEFTLSIPTAKGVLVVSSLGFKNKKITVQNENPIVIRLDDDVANVDEVTVVAYGERSTRELTGSISSLKADDIKEMPSHSLENLLQGRLAGVEINNMSGSPGGGGSVVAIRGYNSLFVEGEGTSRNYGEPLYVVDGVPIHSFSSPVTGANVLSDLDPSMIESLEVLKDAASAAIYGSRAGNGVILITTKKGKEGKAKFTANVSYSLSWLPKTVEQTGGRSERMYHLNALRNTVNPYFDNTTGRYVLPTSYEDAWDKELNRGQYDLFWNGGTGQPAMAILEDSLNPFYNNSTDWFRYSYQVADVVNANLQMSGGNELAQYIIGVGYYDESGIMINSDFSRINLMSNITVKPMKRLRVDSRTYLAFSDRSRGGNLSGGNSKVEGMTVDPIYESTLLPSSGEVENNVLRGLQSIIEKNHSYTLRTSLNLNYEILKKFTFTTSASVDYNQQNQNHFEPSTMYTDRMSRSNGSVGRSIMLLNENLLNYGFTVKNDHNFDLLAGLSFQKDQSYSNGGSAMAGPNDKIEYVGEGWGGSEGLIDIGNGKVRSAHTYISDFEEETMISMFGRLAYNYKKKYLFEATIRRDGSSVFGENVRWGTFPSFSAGWAFSEETFMKRAYWLSFGKIRASWGTSGQKFGQRYLAHGLLTPGAASFLGQGGMTPSGGMINRNLTWEETNQYDLGLDVSLFNYRLKVKLDYYNRYTKAQLHQVNLPGNMSFHGQQWQNAMETSNQGLELEAEIDILRETAVKWRVHVNGSRNWNKLEKSYNEMDIDRYIIGKPLYQMSMYLDDGFYNTMEDVPMYYSPDGSIYPLHEGNGAAPGTIFVPGSRRIKDLDGNGAITENDQYYAASPLPIAHGGIGTELQWKNFDVNILFTYSLGRKIFKRYDDLKLMPSLSSSPILMDINDINAWPNAGANYPKLQKFGLETPFQGRFSSTIENVNMLRLKQLTVGYNLDDHIVKKIGLKGIRVFMTAENLFLLTNYSGLDPESVGIYDGLDNLRNYPQPRKVTLGLTVNF